MLIEVGAPASLLLGLVQAESDSGPKTCLLGLTVQHPPVHLLAQASTGLQVVGPRADKGYEQAVRILQNLQLEHQAEVEIELAIPMFVGLGSETMLGMSMARALAWLDDLSPDEQETPALAQALDLTPQHALEYWGFDRGGLLLVDTEVAPEQVMPAMLRRQEISHKEKDAWAFVFVFPNVPNDTPETMEADRLAALLQAAQHMSSESGRLLTEELWPAVENDDFAAFGASLQTLRQLNEEALARQGVPLTLSADDQAILDLMRDNDALAWGQSFTGVCLYGLVEGAKASQELRKEIRAHIGHFGGIVMATITDNTGARHVVKDENLADNKMTPLRLKP